MYPPYEQVCPVSSKPSSLERARAGEMYRSLPLWSGGNGCRSHRECVSTKGQPTLFHPGQRGQQQRGDPGRWWSWWESVVDPRRRRRVEELARERAAAWLGELKGENQTIYLVATSDRFRPFVDRSTRAKPERAGGESSTLEMRCHRIVSLPTPLERGRRFLLIACKCRMKYLKALCRLMELAILLGVVACVWPGSPGGC